MEFSKLIDTSLLFSLGLMLLISGSILLYCYRRLNLLENSIISHGKILQEFIVNYTNSTNNNLNKNIVLETRENNSFDKNLDIDNRIEIENFNNHNDNNSNNDSDNDSDSDSDNDSDNDNDNDNDSDNDSDNDNDTDNDTDNDSDNDIVRIKETNINDNNSIDNAGINIDSINDSSIKSINIDEQLSNIQELDFKFDLSNLEKENVEKVVNINSVDESSKKPLSKLKVDDLREMVVTKNIMSNEQALKLKKNDLIKLLDK